MRESNFYELSQKTQRKAKQTLLNRYRKYVEKSQIKRVPQRLLGCWAAGLSARSAEQAGLM